MGMICTSMFLTIGAASSVEGASDRELEVIQAMATILNQDAAGSYDYLYYESDFSASSYVAGSLANPDRTQFCGVPREQAQSLVTEIEKATAKPLEFDKSAAEQAGLKIGHKKLERFRYLMLSRVIFDANNQRAWLAVDLNGQTGALMRLEKVDGKWTKTHRCGGWVKAAD